jgi:hypothetical protein
MRRIPALGGRIHHGLWDCAKSVSPAAELHSWHFAGMYSRPRDRKYRRARCPHSTSTLVPVGLVLAMRSAPPCLRSSRARERESRGRQSLLVTTATSKLALLNTPRHCHGRGPRRRRRWCRSCSAARTAKQYDRAAARIDRRVGQLNENCSENEFRSIVGPRPN